MNKLWIILVIALAVLSVTNAQDDLQGQLGDGTLRRINVPILMYHYVSPLPDDADVYRDDLTISPENFRNHIDYLHENGYSTITLHDLYDALMYGSILPTKPIILTFDDGYIDHYEYAFPALEEHDFVGTFFVITGKADAGDPAHLSWTQIEAMADAGMQMESHTKTHPDLREREFDFLVYQILGSLESLTAHTQVETQIFSYPAGRYDEATLDVVATSPILMAVTTQHGVSHTTDGRFELMRLRISGDMSVVGLRNLLNSVGQ